MNLALLQAAYGAAIAAAVLLMWRLRAARRLRAVLGLVLFVGLAILGVLLHGQIDATPDRLAF